MPRDAITPCSTRSGPRRRRLMGMPFEAYVSRSPFRGVARRFTFAGVRRRDVVDDLPSPPSHATLSARRARRRPGSSPRFQPHRYTGTRDSIGSRRVSPMPTRCSSGYPAAGGSRSTACRARSSSGSTVRAGHKDIKYVSKREEHGRLARRAGEPGDLVITLGAKISSRATR